MGWASNFDSCWGQPAKRFNSEIGTGSDGSRYGSKIESLKQWGTFLPSSKCYLWPITSFQCSMITEVKRGEQHETTGSQLSRGSQCQETLCFGVSQNMYIIVHPHKKLQEKVSSVPWDIHLKLITDTTMKDHEGSMVIPSSLLGDARLPRWFAGRSCLLKAGWLRGGFKHKTTRCHLWWSNHPVETRFNGKFLQYLTWQWSKK